MTCATNSTGKLRPGFGRWRTSSMAKSSTTNAEVPSCRRKLNCLKPKPVNNLPIPGDSTSCSSKSRTYKYKINNCNPLTHSSSHLITRMKLSSIRRSMNSGCNCNNKRKLAKRITNRWRNKYVSLLYLFLGLIINRLSSLGPTR